MSRRRLTLAAALAASLALPAAASAADFAPADAASIRPGSETRTAGSGQCTSNFVFTRGGDVYLGQAAHCAGTGEATDTDGCTATSLPLGTKVDVEGATRPGEVVYSSWLAMQRNGEKDPDACAYNDLALVRLDPADVARTNPSVPFFGGPTGLGAGTKGGDPVLSYGNSSLRAGFDLLKPKVGVALGQEGGGWSHPVYTLSPGVPGDSGSAFLSGDGRALGTLSTLALAPLPASNGVGDLAREVAYARDRGGLDGLELATGTGPFDPDVAAGLAREAGPRLESDLRGILSGERLEALTRTLFG